MTEERHMLFLDHLGEPRDRLRNCTLAILVAAAACYGIRVPLFGFLFRPMLGALAKANIQGIGCQLVLWSPMEWLTIQLTTTLCGAVFVASPVIFVQIWSFISPGLRPSEKRWAAPLVISASLLFVGGGLFCYFVILPVASQFLVTAATAAQGGETLLSLVGSKPSISMAEYSGLSLTLLLAFGAIFELPLVFVVLTLLRASRRGRRGGSTATSS